MNLEKAKYLEYPLMGFSYWHRLVANFLGSGALGCNAVICYRKENIVIQGQTFEGNYFYPLNIAIEKSKRYPEGKKICLPDYCFPHEITRIIRNELP